MNTINETNSEKLMALTFDDGPNTSTSLEVLNVLKENDVIASFFLIGNKINETTEETIRLEMQAGHEICCHSNVHAVMNEMTAEEIRADIAESMERIMRVTGYRPAFFRPPFIAVNDTMLQEIDMPFICGVGCNDWVPAVSAEERAELMLKNAEDGQIVLLHDLFGNDNTVQALKVVIPALKQRGFRFTTISELFRLKNIIPRRGIVYSNVFQNS